MPQVEMRKKNLKEQGNKLIWKRKQGTKKMTTKTIPSHTLTPPISSTETESTYPRSSGFGWPSFSCCREIKKVRENIQKLL